MARAYCSAFMTLGVFCQGFGMGSTVYSVPCGPKSGKDLCFQPGAAGRVWYVSSFRMWVCWIVQQMQ